MQNKNPQEIKKYSNMQREGKLRKYSSDGSLPFLALESWGAGAHGFGTQDFYLFQDGKFVKEEKLETNSVFKHGESNVLYVKKEIDVYELNIEMEKVNEIRKFLEENIKEDSSNMIFDAGYDITFLLEEDKKVSVINNLELFNKIKEMLPYKITKE